MQPACSHCFVQTHASATANQTKSATPAAAPSSFGTNLCRLTVSQVHTSSVHTASVNAIVFAPHELGLALAAASSDGSVSILTHAADAGWHTEKVCCRLSAYGQQLVCYCTICLLVCCSVAAPGRKHVLGPVRQNSAQILHALTGYWCWHSWCHPLHFCL